jgi:DNA polymerase-3 subunit delta'
MPLHPLIGHEAPRRALRRAHAAGSLPDALLLRGPKGVGKQRLALWLAQLTLCESATDEGPCDDCRSCRLVQRLEHPDVHWYLPLPRPRGASTPEKMADALEEARFARLAELRETPLQRPVVQFLEDRPAVEGIYLAAARSLRKRAQRRPSMAGHQLFIIGDAESLVPQEASPEAANALLKLLEEPPENTRFILTSSEPGSLLDTIRSRTVPLHLSLLPVEQTAAFLVDHAGADQAAAERAARLAEGAPGRALGFLPEPDGTDGALDRLRKTSVRLLAAALSARRADPFIEALVTSSSGGRAMTELLDSLQLWLRDLAAARSGQRERIVNHDVAEWLERQAAQAEVSPADVSQALALVDQAALEARGNVNPQLIVVGLITGLRRVLRRAA